MPRKPQPEQLNEHEKLVDTFVRCFESAEGKVVLAYLKTVFQDRSTIPNNAHAVDSHWVMVAEGQRRVYLHIKELIEEGLNARAGNNPKPIDPSDIPVFDL